MRRPSFAYSPIVHNVMKHVKLSSFVGSPSFHFLPGIFYSGFFVVSGMKEGLLIVYLTVQNDIRGGGRRYLAVV